MNLQEDIHRIKEVMRMSSEQEVNPTYDFNKTTYNPDDICKIEVEGNTKNVQYPRYWVSVIFKVSLNHLTVHDLAGNIMNEIYTTVNDYFGIPPQMRSAFVRNCEEDTTDLFEGEITERCWKGYTQKGMKTMFGKRYPNCVKKKK